MDANGETSLIPPLEITVDSVKYTVPSKSLLLDVEDSNKSQCVLLIGSPSNEENNDYVLIGQTFLKDYVIAMDYDKKTYSFGLSKSANQGASIAASHIENWIIALIVVAVLVLGFIICIGLRYIHGRGKSTRKNKPNEVYLNQQQRAISAMTMDINEVDSDTEF